MSLPKHLLSTKQLFTEIITHDRKTKDLVSGRIVLYCLYIRLDYRRDYCKDHTFQQAMASSWNCHWLFLSSLRDLMFIYMLLTTLCTYISGPHNHQSIGSLEYFCHCVPELPVVLLHNTETLLYNYGDPKYKKLGYKSRNIRKTG